MLRFENVTFGYSQDKQIVSRLDAYFEKGLVHCVIGASGCGKTTLLYLAAGLLSPGKGKVLVNGQNAVRGREKTAVILQDHGLFPWKTAYQNLTLPLKIRKTENDTCKKRADKILAEIGLAEKANMYPQSLSGGQQQRLAVGRALIQDPDLLLLDEPFSSLDAMNREKLQDYLASLQDSSLDASRPLTTILVTHSIEEAAFLGDRIHIMGSDGNFLSIERTKEKSVGRKSGDRTSSAYFERCRALREALERSVKP
jgi:NitT/TauT family transport system ATP-binding protein